jgi:hypothetical protein
MIYMHTHCAHIHIHPPTPPRAPPGAHKRRGYSMRLHERLCLVARARRLRVAAPVVCAEQTPTRARERAPVPVILIPPFQRAASALAGADDLPGASQAASWGQGLCMALQRPGLIRHGRCRSRACDLRGEPLIIHAAAINHSTTSLGRLLFVVVCATGLHAHSACSRPAFRRRHRGLTLLQPARPRQRGCKEHGGTTSGSWTARFVGGPSLRRAVRLHHASRQLTNHGTSLPRTPAAIR